MRALMFPPYGLRPQRSPHGRKPPRVSSCSAMWLGWSAAGRHDQHQGNGETEGSKPRAVSLPRQRAAQGAGLGTCRYERDGVLLCWCTARLGTDSLTTRCSWAFHSTPGRADWLRGTLFPIQEQAQRAGTRMDLRGIFEADEQGRFWYHDRPCPSPTPSHDGPVGELFARATPRLAAPRTLHYMLRAPACAGPRQSLSLREQGTTSTMTPSRRAPLALDRETAFRPMSGEGHLDPCPPRRRPPGGGFRLRSSRRRACRAMTARRGQSPDFVEALAPRG